MMKLENKSLMESMFECACKVKIIKFGMISIKECKMHKRKWVMVRENEK